MNDQSLTLQSILIISDASNILTPQLIRRLGFSAADDAAVTALNLETPNFSQVSDIFYDGYIHPLMTGRKAVENWIQEAGPSLLIGMGLGGLLALWACADWRDAPIRGVAAVGSTPHLEFLRDRHPYYHWPVASVKHTLSQWDVSYKVPRIGSRAVLLLHGDNDHEIGSNWIEEFFLLATGVSRWPENWEYHRIAGLTHTWKQEEPATTEVGCYIQQFRKKLFRIGDAHAPGLGHPHQ